MISKWSYSLETHNLGQNCQFFVQCDLEIRRMTLENNRAPLLCYFKLCASFHSHLWIQNGVTVRKRSIWVKIGDFLSRVTFKFDWWPWKTIGHLFYATSSFVHHSIAIREFKLELQSGNGEVRFWPLWPWPLTHDLDLLYGYHVCQSLVITPENFMMIRWWEHSEQDRRWNAEQPSATLDP